MCITLKENKPQVWELGVNKSGSMGIPYQTSIWAIHLMWMNALFHWTRDSKRCNVRRVLLKEWGYYVFATAPELLKKPVLKTEQRSGMAWVALRATSTVERSHKFRPLCAEVASDHTNICLDLTHWFYSPFQGNTWLRILTLLYGREYKKL